MKDLRKLLILAWISVSAVTLFGQAQVAPIAPAIQDDRAGRVIVSDPQARSVGLASTTDRQKLSQEIKNLLANFERLRDAYLREQENLRKRERGAATEDEREKIRALIKEARDAWLERERHVREEMKDRVKELREAMPSRAEIFDNARENARDSVQPGRKRRGQE